MKDSKLYEVECGETATVKSTFQRIICQLLKALVLSSGEKHEENKHRDFLQEKKIKQTKHKRNNYKDIKNEGIELIPEVTRRNEIVKYRSGSMI